MIAMVARACTRVRSPLHERGMTLTEALVALLLLSVLFIAFLAVFDASNRMAKSQGNISDATENLRFSVAALVRLTRMAGTGGLPIVYPADTSDPPTLAPLSLEVIDNVSAGAQTYGTRTVLGGTDVLVVRGVISGQLYDIQGAIALATPNKVIIPGTSPWNSQPQTLTHPTTSSGRPLLISLQTPLDIQPVSLGGVRHYNAYRIVTVQGEPTIGGGNMAIDFVAGGAHNSLNQGGSYAAFQEGFAYAAGFIDELTYFIAQNSAGEPALYRFEGVGNPQELVPNIANLQLAFGCDLDRDGVIAEVGENANDDEWILNFAGENPPTGDQMAALREVRLSVVARSQDPDLDVPSVPAMPENAAALTAPDDLRYRYRVISVRVGLRSHPPLL